MLVRLRMSHWPSLDFPVAFADNFELKYDIRYDHKEF